jgi:hypothetical protein
VTYRKDTTLVEILSRLENIEGKIDRFPPRVYESSVFGPPQSVPNSQPSFSTETDDPSSSSSPRLVQQRGQSIIGRRQPYRHASAAHKILAWPAMQQLLFQALVADIGDLKSLEQSGPVFITRMEEGMSKLAVDESLQETSIFSMQSQESRTTGGARAIFPQLTRDMIDELATVYFDTFNLIYPFMDRQNFVSNTLAKVHTEGFKSDVDSVIALLIFALGEMAIDGSRGRLAEVHGGHQSGVRGGTAPHPPGLALFNEARKRMGFGLTEYELENVQIYSLAACVMSPLLLTL